MLRFRVSKVGPEDVLGQTQKADPRLDPAHPYPEPCTATKIKISNPEGK